MDFFSILMENVVYTIGDIILGLHTHRHTLSTMLTNSQYAVKPLQY